MSEGKHEFEYNLDNKFFELIDGTVEIRKGKLKVGLVLKNTSSTFDLSFDINGSVQVPCDRCLDDISMEVSTKNKLIVKFGAEYTEESDEIVVIPEEDGEINIAWFLFEFIALSLPMKHVHPAGQCNKAMSTKLNKHRATVADDDDDDEDDDVSLGSDEASFSDTRWDSLKDIAVDE